MLKLNNRLGVVYIITNKINGKIYVGQTIQSIRIRFIQHYHQKRCHRLYEAMHIYGIDNFDIKILLDKIKREELDFYENYYIDQLDSTNPNIGYNIKKHGKQGIKKDSVKLREEQLTQLFDMEKHRIPHNKIAKFFNINRHTVSQILDRYNQKVHKYQSLAKKVDLNFLKEYLFECNPTAKEIKEELKISSSTLFEFTKSINYHFLTYRQRQKIEKNIKH